MLNAGSKYQPMSPLPGQNIKSSAKDALTERLFSWPFSGRDNEGPTPIIKSNSGGTWKGFLNNRSADNSRRPEVPNMVKPNSSSSQFSITSFSGAIVPP